MMPAWQLLPGVQRDASPLLIVVYVLGILSALRLAYGAVSFLLVYLRPSTLHRYLHHDADGRPAWALVTGASDGIGKHLARELAARGFNVVLHGRDPAKLAAVRRALDDAFPARQFRLLVADALAIPCESCRGRGTPDASGPAPHVDFDAIAASLADVNLTVLVNNAGGVTSRPVYQFLHETPAARLLGDINLNAVFPLLLLSALLPRLLLAPRRRGPALVLDVSSMSENGLPLLAPYSAAKAFLGALGRTLPLELGLFLSAAPPHAHAPVDVLHVGVGETTGTAGNSAPASLFQPHAATVARAALARVGCRRRAVIAYLPHALQQAAFEAAPHFVQDRAATGAIRTRWREEQERIKKSG